MASVCVLEGITEDTMWRVLSVVFQGLGQAGLSVSRWEDTYTLLTDYNYVPACRTLGTNVRVQLGVYMCVCACTCAISLPPYDDWHWERNLDHESRRLSIGSFTIRDAAAAAAAWHLWLAFISALLIHPLVLARSCAPLSIATIHWEKEKSLLFLTVNRT